MLAEDRTNLPFHSTTRHDATRRGATAHAHSRAIWHKTVIPIPCRGGALGSDAPEPAGATGRDVPLPAVLGNTRISLTTWSVGTAGSPPREPTILFPHGGSRMETSRMDTRSHVAAQVRLFGVGVCREMPTSSICSPLDTSKPVRR